MDLVPNPHHQKLQRALPEVRAHVARLEEALDPPHSRFTSGRVWVGKSADAFAADLTGHRNLLRKLAQSIIEAFEAELRGTPSHVTPAEAKNL
ncbi:hypothetical protein HNP84_003605 [Thermocatellispora tengchongensis]|uniref:WXG100 family type VII secretion target n=1 Tax=Thermocatellispora tengchongensis TaxID=1073253 RepID=A0A840P4F5_9ACTN|nr:hypothetical protein [Thermocatellispora tengchongensis]MBB5133879.1 hypothetical protein [Thermocatellispora tengchongensis]